MITARVIRIVSSKQLIFNAGAEHGVTRSMKFRVQSAPEIITDPETGEELGQYPTWKVVVEPDQIFQKFTLASQPFSDPERGDDDDNIYWPDLPVDAESIRPLRPVGSKVEVGDSVEEVPTGLPSAADDDIPF